LPIEKRGSDVSLHRKHASPRDRAAHARSCWRQLEGQRFGQLDAIDRRGQDATDTTGAFARRVETGGIDALAVLPSGDTGEEVRVSTRSQRNREAVDNVFDRSGCSRSGPAVRAWETVNPQRRFVARVPKVGF